MFLFSNKRGVSTTLMIVHMQMCRSLLGDRKGDVVALVERERASAANCRMCIGLGVYILSACGARFCDCVCVISKIVLSVKCKQAICISHKHVKLCCIYLLGGLEKIVSVVNQGNLRLKIE